MYMLQLLGEALQGETFKLEGHGYQELRIIPWEYAYLVIASFRALQLYIHGSPKGLLGHQSQWLVHQSCRTVRTALLLPTIAYTGYYFAQIQADRTSMTGVCERTVKGGTLFILGVFLRPQWLDCSVCKRIQHFFVLVLHF